MEPDSEDTFVSSVSSSDHDQDPGGYEDGDDVDNLLEDYWFFENLLVDSRTRLPKYSSSFSSHPSSSSIYHQIMMAKDSETSKASELDGGDPLNKTDVEEEDEVSVINQVAAEEGKEESEGSKILSGQLQNNALHLHRGGLSRTPSLPPIGGSDFEVDLPGKDAAVPGMKMNSRLTKQISLRSPDSLPTEYVSKGLARSSSTVPRQKPRRIARTESLSVDAINEMRRGYPKQSLTSRKSLRDLEFEELQGFKDLGFQFDKADLDPVVVSILPGLQEKNEVEVEEEEDNDDDKAKKVKRRPYLSEAWQVQKDPPPIPNWVIKRSSEDMKEQIKFWARGVASNVR